MQKIWKTISSKKLFQNRENFPKFFVIHRSHPNTPKYTHLWKQFAILEKIEEMFFEKKYFCKKHFFTKVNKK